MTGTAAPLSILPWAAAALALFFGAWWRDCVLLSGSLPLALHAFHIAMGRGAPWHGWRAGIRCWLAGGLSMLGAAALVVWVAGFVAGKWSAPAPPQDEALTVMLLVGALVWLGRPASPRAWHDLVLGLLAFVAAAGAEILRRDGLAFMPCVFASIVALVMAWLGWKLAHAQASAFIHADARH